LSADLHIHDQAIITSLPSKGQRIISVDEAKNKNKNQRLLKRLKDFTDPPPHEPIFIE